MNTFKTLCCCAAVLLGIVTIVPGTARAEYRCSPPATHIDDRACERAREGPEALRLFIQRMRVIENLYFADYVNKDRLIAWREMEQERARQAKEHEQQAMRR